MHSIVHQNVFSASEISIDPGSHAKCHSTINLLTKIKQSKGQKVIFLNVRSLFAHISELQLDFNNSNYVCLAFTETWLTELTKSDLIKIQGFNLVRYDRQPKKRGGGLIFYIRNDLEWEIIGPKFSTPDIEVFSVFIKRKFGKNLYISLTYIPPSANISHSIEKLDLLGNYVEGTDFEWLLGGDFNVDLSVNNQSRAKRLLVNYALRYSMSQLIKGKTRVSATRASLIDHIYTNNLVNVHDSGVIAYGMSDHHITYINLKRNLPKKQKVKFSCRKLNGYDREQLRMEFDDQNLMNFIRFVILMKFGISYMKFI